MKLLLKVLGICEYFIIQTPPPPKKNKRTAMSEFNVVFLLTHCLLDLHFSGGPVQGPHELSLAKFVVSCDKSSRSDDLVPHLLQRVEHVEGGGGKFNPPVFLVFVLRQGRRLFRQNPKLVKRKSVHCAAEKQTNKCFVKQA